MQERSSLLRLLLPWSRMERMAQVHIHQTAAYEGVEQTENNPSSWRVWDPGAGEASFSHSQPCQTRPLS